MSTGTAADFREDLPLVGRGDRIQALNYALPKALRDGQSHTISVRLASDHVRAEYPCGEQPPQRASAAW